MKQCVRLRSTKSAPIGELRTLDRHIKIAAADVVDQNIDRRPLSEYSLAEVLAHRGLRNVGFKGPRPAPAFPHLAGSLGERVRVARHQNDVGARLRRRKRYDPAEPAAAACDKKALAVDPEAIKHVHATPRAVLA